MTSLNAESEVFTYFDNCLYHDHINKVINSLFRKFYRAMKSYVFFHLFFILIGITEFFLLITFFTFLVESSIFAFGLGFVFLTFFAFFILRIYFQAKKSEQIREIKNQYLAFCKNFLNYQESGLPEHHIALANACCKFADNLHCKEYQFYKLPRWLNFFPLQMEKFSCWCHWQDVHHLQEALLLTSVEENIKLVKCEPNSLEVHAALANAYVMLSGLYIDPRKIEGFDDDRWIPSEKYTGLLQEKFRATAERAIEELKILNTYAPNDPWVHAQLAYSYHDLQMPHEEIREYEILLRLNPDDENTLYKLGVLYFQQGMNAQGLRIYEKIKRIHYKKAESLIKYYGSSHLSSNF